VAESKRFGVVAQLPNRQELGTSKKVVWVPLNYDNLHGRQFNRTGALLSCLHAQPFPSSGIFQVLY